MPPCTRPYIRSRKLESYRRIIIACSLWLQGKQKGVVAVKCIKRNRLTNTSMENLLTEIKVMKQLQHEHIVQLADFQVSCTYSSIT